jgi:DNA (cytosine-5)-methyltransferase 1|tara:strand:+ start:249 stop:1082 length:834 start_codon:yes stop_codon:yes gene_type:complete
MAHLNTFHLFAGAGGGILADLLLGHNPIGACEIEKYPREVLLARQRDGYLPEFPIWDDVCTLDGNHWKGSVDVLCGGFPCQDISAAGKRAGIAGERSGLWKEYARLIREMRPRFVFAENSPLLRTRGLGVVLEDLAALGYHARWCVLGAGHVGAPHKRDRMWVLAYSVGGDDTTVKTEATRLDDLGAESGGFWHTDPAELGNAELLRDGWREQQQESGKETRQYRRARNQENWPTQPIVGRVAHGVAHRVDRLKAIGNGQVPQCAAMAFNILSKGLI